MTSLLICLVWAQISFTENEPVKLQVEPFSFEHVIPLKSGFLICDGEKSVVHIFNASGQILGNLGSGGGDGALNLPSSANWLEERQQYIVYDSGQRCFVAFDAQYQFVEKSSSDLPLFFEAGPLFEVKSGFVGGVSLQDDRYLVGKFNEKFEKPSFGYELVDKQLANLSPVLFHTMIARADMYSGSKILAIQSLATEVTLLSPELKRTGSVSLPVPGWKRPDYKVLAKVSKNPRELEKYRDEYSEIVSIHVIQGSLFVVGFRNILGNPGYTFQCYDASTANALGQTYATMQQPIGAGFDRIYLKRVNEPMVISSIAVH